MRDYRREADRLVKWIADYMEYNSDNGYIVVGLSGGKDSAIAAAACVKAVGPNRVIGVYMPAEYQSHRDEVQDLAEHLGIQLVVFNITKVLEEQAKILPTGIIPSAVVTNNNPARIRMAMLYYLANNNGGRVVNTSNLSETYVGYDTAWGDQCGDFSPFRHMTATEVKQIGDALGVPSHLIEVPPDDGMCGLTDEDRWGFTYETLDAYLTGQEIPEDVKRKIKAMHEKAEFKNMRVNLPSYWPSALDLRLS